ncbi:outer membrane lipoprotein-sorting protein [Clostridium algifaecis]|uniref:Outer membrane lipoprotein-sorting protein n=1 Tax=Clostridium algifaecis TaxID=1472040 RepID=A0ABS4KVR3_9CLOT|nr:germination lipoprotein GerS-related protein [Clostridium algifaecis]MBP2033501.1 outer membrane lipoprotein-sorting protein [Clostridium algifaecis]
MFKKLLIIFIICIPIIFIFSSCSKKTHNVENTIDYLKNLDSYSCNVNIEIENDKQKINYEGKQFYNKEYGNRFELGKDRIFIYKGDKMFIHDLKNGSNYNTDESFDSLFRLCFIDEYVSLIYTNERVDNSFKNIYNEEYQVIGLDIPGNNKNICKAELYVSSEKAVPKYLLIYDSHDREKVKVEYSNFKENIDLQKNLFDAGTVQIK